VTWLDETSLLFGNSLLNLFPFTSLPLVDVLHFQNVDFLGVSSGSPRSLPKSRLFGKLLKARF